MLQIYSNLNNIMAFNSFDDTFKISCFLYIKTVIKRIETLNVDEIIVSNYW